MTSISIPSCVDIFCPPPLGRPGPNHSRIVQKAQEGDTCFLSALNRLRKWYKYEEGADYAEKKAKEEVISEFHKKLNAWSIEREVTFCIIGEMSNNNQMAVEDTNPQSVDLSPCTERFFTTFIEKSPYAKEFLRPKRLKRFFTTLMQEFESQNKLDLPKFLHKIFYQRHQKIHEELVEQLQIADKIEPLFQQIVSRIFSGKRLSRLSSADIHYHIAYELIACDLYQFKLSTWNPSQPIKHLANQLFLYGPLIISGDIGRDFYKDPPIMLQNIKGRNVYGWPDSFSIPDAFSTHCIIIVGAKIEEEWVYFIDPMDASDPANNDSQKIYRISYEELIRSTLNIYGILGEQAAATLPYAYHASQKEMLEKALPAEEQKTGD